jgi:CRP-like cAMP-binding protein
MSTLLLKNLNNADIDWLTDVGELQAAKANTILIEPQPNLDKVYLILSGQLSVLLTQQDEAKELLRLSTGDLAGAIPAIASYLPYATVAAVTDVSVLAVSAQTLVQKLKQDSVFAANFYRSTAQLLRQQLIYWAGQIGYSLSLMGQLQLKEASTVFAEFIDNDLDWMMAVGQVDAVKPGTPVLSCGRPIDALHILLEGAVSLQATATPTPLLQQAFAPNSDRQEQEFARLARGDLIGETVFLEPAPAAFSAIALRDSRLLTIPRWRLTARLLYDSAFAARLYRLLAILLANKQQALLQKLSFLPPDTQIDNQFIERVALAEARFDWLVNRLQSQHTTGDMSW